MTVEAHKVNLSRRLGEREVVRTKSYLSVLAVKTLHKKLKSTLEVSHSDALAEKVPAVSEWSESTMKKLKQVLVRFLVECEYLESSKSQTLLPVYLYPELDELIRSKGDTDALAAFNCFN